MIRRRRKWHTKPRSLRNELSAPMVKKVQTSRTLKAQGAIAPDLRETHVVMKAIEKRKLNKHVI
jgi:hypothetical protein